MATESIHPMENDEASVKELILSTQDWIRYLWSKKYILLISGIVGAVLGLGYVWVKQPTYTATTTFVLEGGDGKGGLSQYAGMAAMVGINLTGNAGGLFEGDNILELYKSRSMLAQTLLSRVHPDSSKLLVERYIDYNDLQSGWADEPELLALDFRKEPSSLDPQSLRIRDSVLTKFATTINESILKVEKPDNKLSIIKVEVTSPDEVFSKTFNENLVRRVNEFYVQTKTKKSQDNIAILERKVDSVRMVMTRSIYSSARTSDATPNLNPTRQVQRIAPVQEAQFSAEANKAILSQLLQNLELTKMNLLQEQPLIQIVDKPVYPIKVNRLGKVKGIIIGGFLLGLFAMLFFIIKKWYNDLMEGD